MRLRHGCVALAAAALLLSGRHASAQTPAPASTESKDATPPAAPSKDATPPAASKEPSAVPYVGFAPPAAPLRIESPSASIQFGLLAQPQLEVAGAPDAEKTSKNLFLHRIRFIVGGTLFSSFEYFFDIDYPDLFKLDTFNTAGGTGKNAPGLNVQDAFVTAKPAANLLKIDAGFMLPPYSHNALQGAGTLYGPDYFVNSHRRNVISNIDPFGSTGQSPQGRDAGVQVRGLLLDDHIEYRAGLFQGLRVGPEPQTMSQQAQVGALNVFRVAARLQINLLDAETGYFYQGTYLGTKKIASVGGFYDFQDTYKSFGADAFLDLPAGPGIVTAQANYVGWDGGAPNGDVGAAVTKLQALPKSTAMMFEAGYLIRAIMLSPTVRVERLTVDQPTAVNPSEDRFGGGLSFWPYGHNSNIKAFFARVHRDPCGTKEGCVSGTHDFNQINLQWQVYFY
jgi:hypothetical protein